MQHHHSRARKSGFTLIEIVVVLIIITLISSILFSAFKSIREGNKKTSCQANLAQIYQALRLYGQDYNGELPSFNPANPDGTGKVDNWAPNGLGLWALYAYPASDKLDCDGRTTQLPTVEPNGSATPPNYTPPLASYIKSPSVFHCPYDDYDQPVVIGTNSGCNLNSGTKLNSSQMTFTDNANLVRFNPFYNSYQTADTFQTGSLRDQAPYSSFRTSKARRQLVYWETNSPNNIINTERRTPDTTILTWCRFHRKTNQDGTTVDKLSNSDNVLFMDGTVQYVPTKQDIGTASCQAWTRAPLEDVSSLSSGNVCLQ